MHVCPVLRHPAHITPHTCMRAPCSAPCMHHTTHVLRHTARITSHKCVHALCSGTLHASHHTSCACPMLRHAARIACSLGDPWLQGWKKQVLLTSSLEPPLGVSGGCGGCSGCGCVPTNVCACMYACMRAPLVAPFPVIPCVRWAYARWLAGQALSSSEGPPLSSFEIAAYGGGSSAVLTGVQGKRGVPQILAPHRPAPPISHSPPCTFPASGSCLCNRLESAGPVRVGSAPPRTQAW